MAPQDIFKKINATPFKPFRLFLSDGKTYDVTDRAYAYLTPTELVVGIGHDEYGLPLKSAYISPNHVVRVEPLEASNA